MEISFFDIPGPALITPRRWGDQRGFFSETFRSDVFCQKVTPAHFVQDNHSVSEKAGTLRGLHYQANPKAQGKLVRVTRGAILDVACDVRHGSPTFGQHIAVELTADNWQQLWVPPGFLHGFCTLVDDVEVVYKVTDYYSAEHDGSVRWNDQTFGIKWPFPAEKLTLSAKDINAPALADMPARFEFVATPSSHS